MIERLAKPVAIAVATGTLLVGCSDASPRAEPVTVEPGNDVGTTAEVGTTVFPDEPECVPLVSDNTDELPSAIISFQGINASLIQKHVPFEPIVDLEPVTGTKRSSYQRSATFLRVTKNSTGSLCYESEVTDTTAMPQINSLLAAVSINEPFLSEAMDKGELDEVNFRIVAEDSLLDSYDAHEPVFNEADITSGKERAAVNYPLDPRYPISASDVSVMLRHEVIHALTGDADLSLDNEIQNLPRAEEFASACSMLRDIASKQASSSAEAVTTNLQEIAKHANAEQAVILNNVIKSIQNGTFGTLQPESGEYDRITASRLGYGNVPECKAIGPWYVALREMDRQHIGYKDLVQLMVDNQTLGASFNGVVDGWNDLLRQETIYRVTREAPYLSDADVAGYSGHPWDGWDETVTSLLNVAITFPDTFVSNVRQLPTEQAQAIKNLLGQSSQVFKQLHPDMNEVNATLESIYQQL